MKKDTKWKKVRAPKYWRPTEAGETAEGKFAGLVQCNGRYGPYLAVALSGPDGMVYVTGTKAVSLTRWVHPVVGQTELRFVFMGRVEGGEGGEENEMKDYELFTR